jgi:hypothetical protein
MERRFKNPFLCVLLVLTSLFFLPGNDAFPQAMQGDVSEAIKEAQSAGIGSTTLNHLLTLGYQNEVGSKGMAGFIRVLTEAQREGFPLEPFTNKIEEGVAKRVPSPLIETVLAKKFEDYQFTKSTIQEAFEKHGDKKPVIPHGYLSRLSESLSCGLSREELRTLVEHGSSPFILPPLAMAAETMASLKQNQFDPAMAQQIALAGLKHNYFTPERIDIARIIIVARQKGIPDPTVTTAVLETFQTKGSLQGLASRLGVTSGDLGRGPALGDGQSRPSESQPPVGAQRGSDMGGGGSGAGRSGGRTAPGGGGRR